MPTIKISDRTKERLDNAKHTGQSYDGIINEVLDERGIGELTKKALRKYAKQAKGVKTK